MKEFIELPGRVVSLRVEEGPAGSRVVMEVESGPGFTEEEAADLMKRVIADVVSRGIDVKGWGFGEGVP